MTDDMPKTKWCYFTNFMFGLNCGIAALGWSIIPALFLIMSFNMYFISALILIELVLLFPLLMFSLPLNAVWLLGLVIINRYFKGYWADTVSGFAKKDGWVTTGIIGSLVYYAGAALYLAIMMNQRASGVD